jgi:2-methylcitrate synthase
MMTTESPRETAVVKGLKGVMAADSFVCLVNGTEGKLLYCGYNIDDLARHSSFEEVAYLLLNGKLPRQAELDEFKLQLAAGAKLNDGERAFLKSIPKDTLPMTALRSAASVSGIYDPEGEDISPEGAYRISVRLIAKIATLVAAIHRLRQGLPIVEPKPQLGFAANFMSMLNGREPSADEARAMDLILILHAEHGFNASTFTGRVIIATLPDVYSAVTGAIGALKGKLHGGANTEVLKTLQSLGSMDAITPWVKSVRESKGKFMGFGHAVYQTEDPRAKHLKELSRRLGQEQGNTLWYDMSAEIEKQVTAAIGKNCNVDFYSASLQHYMGVPGDLFTCIFASSRIAGWCAHILEQLSDNKIIRPSANYVGPKDAEYVPIDQR